MLEVAKLAAKKAGDFLWSNFGNIGDIISKGDRNLATDLDRKAEDIIVDILSKEFPSYGILGEERTRRNLKNDSLWIIDPLDGTHNFIRGIPVFGVSIGLWQKDSFVLGVVYLPREGELYWAEKNKGAFKNGERIFTSQVSELKKASGCFDSSIRYSPQIMLKVLGEVVKNCFNVRMFGSSARTLTYLAEGKIDFSIEFYDRPWDFAGSVCLIEEAGGVFLDLKGKTPTPRTIGYIACSNSIYPELKECLDKVIPKG